MGITRESNTNVELEIQESQLQSSLENNSLAHLLSALVVELKIANYHLAFISGEEISKDDLENR